MHKQISKKGIGANIYYGVIQIIESPDHRVFSFTGSPCHEVNKSDHADSKSELYRNIADSLVFRFKKVISDFRG